MIILWWLYRIFCFIGIYHIISCGFLWIPIPAAVITMMIWWRPADVGHFVSTHVSLQSLQPHFQKFPNLVIILCWFRRCSIHILQIISLPEPSFAHRYINIRRGRAAPQAPLWHMKGWQSWRRGRKRRTPQINGAVFRKKPLQMGPLGFFPQEYGIIWHHRFRSTEKYFAFSVIWWGAPQCLQRAWVKDGGVKRNIVSGCVKNHFAYALLFWGQHPLTICCGVYKRVAGSWLIHTHLAENYTYR